MIDEKNKKNPESIDNEEGVKEERNAARLHESDELENTAGAGTGEKVGEGSEVREKVMEDNEVLDKSEKSEIDESKALRDEIKNLKDENARLRAEFINYRNALVRESEESIRRYREKIIVRLIEIYDDLSRALENPDNSKKSLISGIKLIHKSVERLMFDEGLSVIMPEVGKPFDPFSHEVEGTISSNDVPDMAVYDVIERGYNLNGKVLKPARVVVAVNDSSES